MSQNKNGLDLIHSSFLAECVALNFWFRIIFNDNNCFTICGQAFDRSICCSKPSENKGD